MNTELPSNDLQLKEAFGKILSTENFSDVINEIAELIYKDELNKQTIEDLYKKYGIKQVENIKGEILDLLLYYTNLILDDNFITTKEAENIKFLKRFFKIKEGDFYHYKYHEIEMILNRQFGHMYQDNVIDNNEALHKVDLQELFDLGYDQFLELINKAVKDALSRGAKLKDLDTFINPDRK